MISCRVLGPAQVLVDGRPAPPQLLWRKNLALLIYLARSPKRARAREHLLALLWPDKPEPAARHSLREAMRAIRQAGGDSVLEISGDQVALSSDQLSLDVDRFAQLTAAEDWLPAAALVGGEFLEGFGVGDASAFEDWMAAERLAWRHRCVEAVTRAAEVLLARGELGAATEWAFRASALDPVSEHAVGTAMRCLALAGDRAGALRQLERYEQRSGGGSGATRSDGLRAIADTIRRERTLRVPEYLRRDMVAGAESRRAPLVGRGEELSQLMATWGVARDRRTFSLGLVLGEPGTGKTRMLEETAARARLDGAAVTIARAVPADKPEPWAAWYQLAAGGLGDAAGVPAASPDAIRVFARRLPEWAERFGTPGPDQGHSPPGGALAEVLRAASQESPVVAVLDDAHWADAQSLASIAALARDLTACPVLLLLAAAPFAPRCEIDELRARLGRELQGTTVTLDPLGVGEVRHLAGWALPDYGDDARERLTRRVLADSGGFPLLVVELLHAVALGMELSQSSDPWPHPTKTLDQTLPGELPDQIVAATRVGFRRLSANAQRALAAIATIGERTPIGAIRRATGLSDDRLGAALDELEWQRWVTTSAGAYGVVARITRAVILRDLVTPGQRDRFIEAARD